MQFTAEIIAGFLDGQIVGDPATLVNTMAKIEDGTPGSLAFLSNPKYEHYIYDTKASIVIVAKTFMPTKSIAATLVKVDDPYASFAKLLELYIANKPQKQGVSSLAVIDDKATIGKDVYVGEYSVICAGAKIGDGVKIYPQVYVGDNVRIGNNVILYPGVKIYEECLLGDNVIAHSGAVIGADGFGFAPNKDGSYSKIPQIGNVVIERDVEIGANTCVDRATMGSTIVKHGTKLDNLIQVAHNVVIGSDTVLAAQFGIAGSSKLGNNCMAGGQVGVVGHINVGNNVKIGSKSGVTGNIPDGETHMGYPSLGGSKFHRSNAIFRNLPDLNTKVNKMEKELAQLRALLELKSE